MYLLRKCNNLTIYGRQSVEAERGENSDIWLGTRQQLNNLSVKKYKKKLKINKNK